MPLQREFMDWNRPALHSAVDYLVDRFSHHEVLDLDSVVVVLPGSRAGRRLQELLTLRSAEDELRFRPPMITTVGQLPELLYQPMKPFASELTRWLAWIEALRSIDANTLEEIVPHPPQVDDFRSWMEFGQLLEHLHRELASDLLMFRDVRLCGESLTRFPERQRWKALEKAQRAYHDQLDQLELWDRQTARTIAIEKRECWTDKQLVMLGTADINRSMRRMLDQVEESVTSLVFAPADLAGRFDEYGALEPNSWREAEIEVESRNVYVVDSPSDQAEAAARILASWNNRWHADEIAIGLPDNRLSSFLQRRLAADEIRCRNTAGETVRRSAPFTLLTAVAHYLETGSFTAFASLVRHPDVYLRLSPAAKDEKWLESLDRYQTERLPTHMDVDSLKRNYGYESLLRVRDELLACLKPVQGKKRKLPEWSIDWNSVLLSFYHGREFDKSKSTDDHLLFSLSQMSLALQELSETSSSLPAKISAAQAIRLAMSLVADKTMSDTSDPEAINLIGWLDLPWDDTPAAVVTSFNEGIVPSAERNDLFLPEPLRRGLGIVDQSRRYARDAYAANLLLHTKQDVKWILGRRNADGDPLAPSRLLFTGDKEKIARDAAKLFAQPLSFEKSATAPNSEINPDQHACQSEGETGSASQLIPIPKPDPNRCPEVNSLSPTAFRTYLQCPYRFYLKHVLRLDGATDEVEELDGARFGSIAHTVVETFGESDVANSTDAGEIRKTLNQLLDTQLKRCFESKRLPPVDIQVEQMRFRLNQFAIKQAERSRQGWTIHSVEKSSYELNVEIGNAPFKVHGRIDRIDYHPERKEVAIFDYKTSDGGGKPDEYHRSKGEWIDLQLPLYRLMVQEHLRSAGLEIDQLSVGYIRLPRDASKVGFVLAQWTTSELDEAWTTAKMVMHGVKEKVFWPPTERPPAFSEEFARICQDTVFDRWETGADR